MSEDRDRNAPSLEPPSLFGRKRRKTSPAQAPAGPVDPVDPVGPDTIFDDATAPTRDLVATRAAEPVPAPATGSPLTPPPAPTPREPRPPREPWLVGRPAAILTGLLVGGLIVAATAGSLRVCTEIKGTSSCGDQGFFLLVAILAVAVLLGATMLRLAHVPEPGSTSFLAVGLLSVAALLFLVGSIFEWWMAIVIPLVSVATFLLSHWVTSTYVDPENDASDLDREPEPHDIR